MGSQGKYLPTAVLPLSLGLPGKKTTYRAENNVSTTIRFKTVISRKVIFKFSFKIRTVLGSTELLRSTELFFFTEVTKSRWETENQCELKLIHLDQAVGEISFPSKQPCKQSNNNN